MGVMYLNPKDYVTILWSVGGSAFKETRVA